MRTAICMVVKNEIDDIPQWVIHHQNVGFDSSIIYGNGATDGSVAIIEALKDKFNIIYMPWPTPNGMPKHTEIYDNCLEMFKEKFDWIAFVDADEYIVPARADDHISTLLEQHADHPAIGINWLIFGTSNVADTNGTTNLEALTHRAEDNFSANRNVKSIVQPKLIYRDFNPHAFLPMDDGKTYNLDGDPIEWSDLGIGIVDADKIIVGSWRVHHYMIRSLDHWARRMARGSESKGASWEEIFRHHDRNEVEDLTARPWAEKLRRVMDENDIWQVIEACRTDKSDRRVTESDEPVLRSEPVKLTFDTVDVCQTSALGAAAIPECEASLTAGEASPPEQSVVVPFVSRHDKAPAQPLPADPVELVTPAALPHNDEGLLIDQTIEFHLDEVTSFQLRGWAVNHTDPAVPVMVHVLVDGQETEIVTCGDERLDVKGAGYPTASAGFQFPLGRRFFNGQTHRLEFRNPAGNAVRISTGDGFLNHYDIKEKWKPQMISSVDGMHEGVIKGWVIREEQDGRWVGGCNVLVTCEGVQVANLKANRNRGDVGKAHAADPYCGFEFTCPPAFRKSKAQEFRFMVVPYDVEMKGSPYKTSFVSDGNEAALLDLNDSMDRMYVELTRLRRHLKTMLPKRIHNIADYDAWARVYFDNLRSRVDMERHSRGRGIKSLSSYAADPLVSILCPTWRPKMNDFCAAVESVIAQSYPNWELIIVDDGSGQEDLTAQINAYIKRDVRIRAIKLSKNVGISGATNAGLKAARGDWIAFFDHDDLLVPIAVELMVGEAARTGAKFLYSDEDKIDDSGYYSEPAFKTDWNYRLLLGCNYICHFVMVDMKTVKKVGFFDDRYNGAQDHDFLLRVSELIQPDEIHHVDEVLYHWRKSETSTASSTGAKQYAVDAGIRAVSDHLDRRGKRARVTSFNESTWYKIHWEITTEPKVTIIVPYKEQIKITRNCIDCILAGTDYSNFDVVLVDNWSTSEESVAFADEMNRLDNVQVLRFEEEFNYSRINNVGARISNADFFVLMNNDLFVTDASWLRTMVNEALAGDKVGIVGGKFVYPNRRVQHAGVVLGVGGVACHSHSGIGENDPGYAARALFAQEMTAVTAACLLIRSDIFWRVGGLDEKHLTVAFNDVDLCIKVRLAGYKVIWTPEFLAEHHESLSRGSDEIRPEKEARFFHEMQTMIERYGDYLKYDPYYSKHFTLEHRPFYDLSEPDARRKAEPSSLLPMASRSLDLANFGQSISPALERSAMPGSLVHLLVASGTATE